MTSEAMVRWLENFGQLDARATVILATFFVAAALYRYRGRFWCSVPAPRSVYKRYG
jgi:hypothetical protein